MEMRTAALAVLTALVPAEADQFQALATKGDRLNQGFGLENEADTVGDHAFVKVVKLGLLQQRAAPLPP